jgi:hypothetical protein
MNGKNTAVFGIFSDRASVESAIDALKAAGYRNTDISVMFSENPGTKDFAHRKATKAPEGAAAGAGSGAVLGGTLGWLVSIGAIAIPGMGMLMAAGPIIAALAGAGAGGAVGGLTGAFIGLGIPEYEAKRYAGRLRKGGILLSVHSDNSDWTTRTKGILEKTGAQHVSSTSEARADFAKSDRPMPRSINVSEYDMDYRRDFETRYQGRGFRYEQHAPAYQLGSARATDARYENIDWHAVEPALRREWEAGQVSSWESVKESVRYGWERGLFRKQAA